MTRRTWSKERVVQAILARQQQGLPFSTIYQDDINLYAAGKRYFGTWNKALQAAGLPEHKKRWSRKAVVCAILARQRQGLPLAGLTPRTIERWSKERIIAELRYWDGQSRHVVRLQDQSLLGAAARFFGSVEEATKAAGVELRQRRWSRQRIIDTIQDRYIKGLPIAKAGFGQVALALVAKKRFGSWREAVTAAGLGDKLPPPKTVRNWSQRAIIEAVVLRHRQGLRLSKTWKTDTGLYSAAKKHFGGWPNVLCAAGLPVTRRRWSKERVVQDIRAWYRRGVPLSGISRQDPCLTTAAIRLFGSWRDALLAALDAPR